MKALITLILLSICFANANADFIESKLMLDKANKEISAPTISGSYHWYVNDEKIENPEHSLRIETGGTYRLEVLDESGKLVFQDEVAVGIDQEGEVYRIILIGDSTMQQWSLPQAGWGQVFQPFFDSEHVEVINEARSGRSSKSYYEESDWWPRVRETIQTGDYVLIQFGINDRRVAGPDRHTDPSLTWEEQFPNGSTVPSFKWYLKNYLDESIAKGAHPILCTTIRRGDTGGYGDYAQATRDLAKEFDIPLVDIDSLGEIIWTAAGAAYTDEFWHYPDVVHLSEMGAIKTASLAIEGLKLNAGDPDIDKIIAHIAPTYEINVTTTHPDDVVISRSENWPAGVAYTFNAIYDNQSLAWGGWLNENDSAISYEVPYRMTVEATDYNIEAKFGTDFSKIDCSGYYGTGAEEDDCGLCVGGPFRHSGPCTGSFADTIRYRITSVDETLCISFSNTVKRLNCENSSEQLWWIEASQNGHFKLRNDETGTYMQMSSNRSSLANMDETGTNFRFESAEQGIFRIAPEGVAQYNLSSFGQQAIDGARIQLSERKDTEDQLFKIEPYALDLLPVRKIEGLNIYPNPVQEHSFTIDNRRGFNEAAIFNLDGSLIQEFAIDQGENTIETNKNLKGIFIIRLSGEKGNYQQKLIIGD